MANVLVVLLFLTFALKTTTCEGLHTQKQIREKAICYVNPTLQNVQSFWSSRFTVDVLKANVNNRNTTKTSAIFANLWKNTKI